MPRINECMPAPASPKYKMVHIGFTSPGGDAFNTDKDKYGYRYDSVGIVNGFILAGCSCDRVQYDPDKTDEMKTVLSAYDGFFVRINPGQLSNEGVVAGAQEKFDTMMREFVKAGKPVWSSPDVQLQMGAKDALVKINALDCGLPDTMAYYSEEALIEGFKKTCAFQPRVIKQNRGSAGEGIWLVWLQDKEYCASYGAASLEDGDKLKLMEMNDNHVEYHTVKEFLTFCISGSGGDAGEWKSVFNGKYLEGGVEAGGQLVDQRLLPRISEGEVRMLMVKNALFQIIHKKPQEGGMSAVGGINIPTFYKPDAPEYADLKAKFVDHDIPILMGAMGLGDQPLPLLWTGDFIPADSDADPTKTVYIVGEFNCSCVGISNFGKGCGPDKDLSDVTDENYEEAMSLTKLIGLKAVETLDEMKK